MPRLACAPAEHYAKRFYYLRARGLAFLFLRSHPLIAPVLLRLVERLIGAVEQSLPVLPVYLVLGNANTDRYFDILLARLDQQGSNMFAQSIRLLRGGFQHAVRQDDQKFISAVAPNRIGVTDVIPQFSRQTAQ